MNLNLKYTEQQLDIFFPEQPARHTIIPKGRRFGATHGAANACIEWGVEGMPMLWGDTIFGNIKRYWDRYFKPSLHANGMDDNFNEKTQVAKIGSGFIDFRSADRPENWEGFGYRKIILNEAGIILKDDYLYKNAVRPMMLDFSDSELFALGVPKGKMLKSGEEHPFYKLWQRVGTPGYRGTRYSSYDNPLIGRKDVDDLIAEIGDPEQVKQEVFGEFIDRVSGNPFAFAFDRLRHVKPCQLVKGAPVIVVIDFNLDPFCAIIAQQQGKRMAITHEISIQSGTIEELATRIRAIVPDVFMHEYTGDRSGANRRIQSRTTASMWDDFLAVMGARERQLKLPANPTHRESREQTNYVLHHHPEFVIDPSCSGLIFDMENVEVDADHSIIKSDRSKAAQRADFLDTGRYLVNTYLRNWIDIHRKTNALQRLPPSVPAPAMLRR
jgi:hypothetical protein